MKINMVCNLDNSSLKNQFLIAMPHLDAAGFNNTVIYICEHDEKNGAMGLIINRPTKLSLGSILRQMNIKPELTDNEFKAIYAGGPVQSDRGFILHANNKKWQSTIVITDEISLTTSKDILIDIAQKKDASDCLVALGYASWEAGQLERECSNNYWLNVPANIDIIFDTPSDDRLNAAAKLMGINLNQVANYIGHA